MANSTAVVLGVRDVRGAVDYFTNVLGFHAGPNAVFDGVDEAEGAVYGIVDLDGAPVHLQIRRREVFAGPRESIEGDAYVYVEDANALYEQHVAAGATIHRPLEQAQYGMRDYTVETPEGHRITFGSPTS